MENAVIILFVVVMAILFLSSVSWVTYLFARATFNAAFGDVRSRMLPIKPGYKIVLKKYFDFYKRLSPPNKKLFERKVQYFITAKTFIPRNIPKVTDEMKALIAASAVQLTFGYPKVILSHFTKILVYPDDYYSMINKKNHKGEVNPGYGIIVLSWKNFVEGYINAHDSRNLGLHEMAHALRFENRIQNEDYNFLDPSLLGKWKELSISEREKMENGTSTFLRDYAMTDREEFFAAAVEHFFENPEKFNRERPELYQTLSGLLRQDPLQLFNLG